MMMSGSVHSKHDLSFKNCDRGADRSILSKCTNVVLVLLVVEVDLDDEHTPEISPSHHLLLWTDINKDACADN